MIYMASRYKFSEEEIKAIERARRDNKDKRAEARLKALELRAKGAKASEVAEATGFHDEYGEHFSQVFKTITVDNGSRVCS